MARIEITDPRLEAYITENLTPYQEHQLQRDYFNPYIDELHETCKIFNVEYTPSQILKECDEIAYNYQYANWLDAALEEGEFAQVGGEIYDGKGVEDAMEEHEEIVEELEKEEEAK